MTDEELKKLVEIAGLKLSAVGELLYSGSRFYRPNNEGRLYPYGVIPVYDWQPHIRIDQAMMVAEAYRTWNIRKDFVTQKYEAYVGKREGVVAYASAIADTPALAICRACLSIDWSNK